LAVLCVLALVVPEVLASEFAVVFALVLFELVEALLVLSVLLVLGACVVPTVLLVLSLVL